MALNQATQSTGRVNDRLNRLRRRRNDFWRAYAEQYPGEVDLAEDHSHSNIFHDVGGALVSQYVSDGSVGIYLVEQSRSYDAEASRLVSTYGEGLQLNLGGSSESLAIDTNNRDNWPDMIDWLNDKLAEYRKVIDRYASEPTSEVSDYGALEFGISRGFRQGGAHAATIRHSSSQRHRCTWPGPLRQ